MPRSASFVLICAVVLASCTVSITNEEAKAAFRLGYDNQHGINMSVNLDKAAMYYKQAAEGGLAEAQFAYGNLLISGSGVVIDHQKAIDWFRKAAEQGLPQAQYNLANAYRTGDGIRQDFDRALQWYRNAADGGYAPAQYNLGAMYGNGEGVPQDYAQAYYWLLLSSKQGYAEADKYLKNFKPELKPETRSRIEQEVAEARAAFIESMKSLASSSADSTSERSN